MSLQQHSIRMLQRMQQKEQKLRSKLQGKDSSLAGELFQNSEEKYKALQTMLAAKADTSLLHPLEEYIPNLDSLQTALSFLKQGEALQNLSSNKLSQLNEVSGCINPL